MANVYAVVRAMGGTWQPACMCAPRYVISVEKETKASLLGMLLDEDGNEADLWSGYDARPSYERSWGGRSPSVRKKAGRVAKDRELARFGTAGEAMAALAAMVSAWEQAAIPNADDAAQELRSAEKALSSEKDRLREETQRALEPFEKAVSVARKALRQLEADGYKARLAAALKAAGRPE